MKTIQYQYSYCIPGVLLDVMPFLEQRAVNEVDQYKPEYLWEMITLIAIAVRKNEGESEVSAKFLERIVPKYRQYIQFLIHYGILESDNHYIVGERCKAYWFAKRYRTRFEFRPIKSAWLIRRIEKTRATLPHSKSFPEQMRHLKRTQITDDAFTVIDAMPSVHQQNCAMAQIAKIRSGLWVLKTDNTSGRLNHVVTTLPSALRPCLHINGVKLSTVDVSNSQPYFTILLLNNPKSVARFARSKKLVALLETLEPVDTVDAKMFIYLVRTGRMYEYLMANGFTGSRDTVKRKMFVVMYGSPVLHKHIPESVIFERMFPSVFERIETIKGGRTRRSDDRFESYKRLAILLQTIEANIVLNTISKRIGRERPDVAVITIHDSVMTGFMSNHVEYVRDVMNDELTKFVGYPPTLHIENPLTVDEAIEKMLSKCGKTKQETPGTKKGKERDKNLHIVRQNLATN